MTYFIVWLAFGIATGIVASNKGRNGGLWFLLGVLLGPIGLLFSLVVSKNIAVMEKDAVGAGDMKKCPFCAELVRAEAKVCRFCQHDLPTPLSAEEQAKRRAEELEQRRQEDDRKPKGACPNCESVIPLDAPTCPKCKASFEAGSAWQIKPIT